jgi:hypothetical protein
MSNLEMAKSREKYSKVSCKNDPKFEKIIKEGCQILAAQRKPCFTEVAQQLTEKHFVYVPYDRL